MEDERQLAMQAVSSPSALGELYDRYYDRVYRYAWRHLGRRADAEDATAATFESVLRALPRYRPGGAPFAAWLFAIAARRVADLQRQRSRVAQLQLVAPGAPAEPTPPESAAEHQAELAVLHAALGRLRPTDRQVLDLHFFAGLSHAEAAPLLGCTQAHVAVRLHRALQRLSAAFSQSGGEPLS